MRSGKLRNRVTVKSYTLAPDGAGGSTPTPTDALETWASIVPIKGQRLLQYSQIVQGTWYDIVMRFRDDTPIVKDFTLDYKGRPITIHSVINKDERNKTLQIVGYEKS